MRALLILAQGSDGNGDGLPLPIPDGPVQGLAMAAFVAALVWLWFVVRRTRFRAEEDHRDRIANRRADGDTLERSAPVDLDISVGDCVVITAGRFDGAAGTVESVDPANRRVQVRISAEPRSLLVDVPVEAVAER